MSLYSIFVFKQKTAYEMRISDWSSDVCSSDLYGSQQGQIVKQLRDNGVSQQIASYSAFAIPSTLSMPEAKGAIFTSQKVDWDKSDDITRRMLDDYKKIGRASCRERVCTYV